MSITPILAVAAGGAIGAVSRYLIMVLFNLSHLPYGTIFVNIIGSFLLGSLLEISALAINLSPNLRLFLVVGLLGAFTTFSTFSMDTVYLIQQGNYKLAAIYMLTSVTLGVLAFIAGMTIFKTISGN